MPAMRWSIYVACLVLAGCASNASRIDDLAARHGMTRVETLGAGLRSLLYIRSERGGPPHTATIFLEGDGMPWIAGRQPARDPTTARPVALELLFDTPGARAYVTRPCYHELNDAACGPWLWTHGRYSEAVVASMAAVIDTAAQRLEAERIVLVGYSGGGVLAVLVAERLARVAAVITVAANLDVDAWARHHGYLPLEGSLDPARSNVAHPWREVHYAGGRDTVVPVRTTDHYFTRYPRAARRILDNNDHVCCWIEQWPDLLAQALR